MEVWFPGSAENPSLRAGRAQFGRILAGLARLRCVCPHPTTSLNATGQTPSWKTGCGIIAEVASKRGSVAPCLCPCIAGARTAQRAGIWNSRQYSERISIPYPVLNYERGSVVLSEGQGGKEHLGHGGHVAAVVGRDEYGHAGCSRLGSTSVVRETQTSQLSNLLFCVQT